MVNHGASNGCLTCKERRVKCDERRPTCARCATRGVTCGGYGKKPMNIRFKEQKINTQQLGSAVANRSSSGIHVLPLVNQPSQDEESLAMNFFINGFAIGGRSLDTSRGFFESVVPVLNGAESDSAVSVATRAVSALLLHRWRKKSDVLDLSRTRLGQALQRLQADLREPIKRSSEATLLAILMLQCYENTRALTQWDKPRTVHQDGALMLIKSLGLNAFRTEYAKRLLLYLMNADINAALREGRSVDPDIIQWAEAGTDMPWNMSSQLDLIAARLAELQERFIRLQMAAETPISNENDTVIGALLGDLGGVLKAFELWEGSVPHFWRPWRFQAMQQLEPPVEMYLNTCEVYPTIESASIWNTWRIYSVIALDLLRQVQASVSPADSVEGSNETCITGVRNLLDSLCYSVPFYLGNRSKPSSVENAPDTSIVFPSYHTLHLFGVKMETAPAAADIMTAEAFQSNATTQGAWQLSSVLRLLVFTLSKPTGVTLRQSLRDSQLKWIEGQVLRLSALFGISKTKSTRTSEWTR